jgi:hypothetical protein
MEGDCIGKKRKDKAPSETGRDPEQVAGEATWSRVFIHLLQSVAQALC